MANCGTITPGFGGVKTGKLQSDVVNEGGNYEPNCDAHMIDELKIDGLYDKANLIMGPAGFNTGKLYSIVPEDRSGDFTVSRASKSSRVGSDGYIHYTDNNTPTLDYSKGECPTLNVQPSSTNKIVYYKSFEDSYWTPTGLSVDTNGGNYYSSPFKDSSGNIVNCARKLVASAANPKIELGTGIDMSGSANSAKGYIIKPINEKEYTLNGSPVNFDDETYGIGIEVIKLADGWYYLTLAETSGSAEKNTLIGTSISSGDMCYLSYSQLEAQQAATSPISDVTIDDGAEMSRAVEGIDITDFDIDTYLQGGGNLTVFTDVYITPVGGYPRTFVIGSSNAGGGSSIGIGATIRDTSKMEYQFYDGTTKVNALSTESVPHHKGCIVIDQTNSTVKIFSNGTKIKEQTGITFDFSGYNDYIALANTNIKYVEHKQFMLYKTALTDAEAIKLTTP